MPIYLLDDSLSVDIYYEECDCTFEDNICVSIEEECPEDEKVFLAEINNLYLTPQQARELAAALLSAADASERACPGPATQE